MEQGMLDKYEKKTLPDGRMPSKAEIVAAVKDPDAHPGVVRFLDQFPGFRNFAQSLLDASDDNERDPW